jgi:hypothetical protein|mmetsp:Transcript_23142/g.71561  ORF Transcript_23142/g.71561 Transcript_23142/m.71561 type:complete len:271 (+) Transcript_23142:292-1104(+)
MPYPDIASALPPERQEAVQAAALAQQQKALAAAGGNVAQLTAAAGAGGVGVAPGAGAPPGNYGLPPGMTMPTGLTPQQLQQMGLPPGMSFPAGVSAAPPHSAHQQIPPITERRGGDGGFGSNSATMDASNMLGKSYEEEFSKWRQTRKSSIVEPTGVMVMDEDNMDMGDDEGFEGIFGPKAVETIGLITSQYPEAAPSLQEPPPADIFGTSPMVNSSLGVSPGLAKVWQSVAMVQNRRNSTSASPNLLSFGSGSAFPGSIGGFGGGSMQQ